MAKPCPLALKKIHVLASPSRPRKTSNESAAVLISERRSKRGQECVRLLDGRIVRRIFHDV
jgi:hypothetical protein